MSTAAENFLRRHLLKSWPHPVAAVTDANAANTSEPAGAAAAPPSVSFSGFGLAGSDSVAPAAVTATLAAADGGPALDLELDLCLDADEPGPRLITAAPGPSRVDLDLPLETVPAILWRSDLGVLAESGPQRLDAAEPMPPAAIPAAAADLAGHGEPASAARPRWQGHLDTTLAKAWASAQLVAVLRIGSERLGEVAAALGSEGEAQAQQEFGRRLQAVLADPALGASLTEARLQALPEAHLIILPGLRSASLAETLARRCLEALARPVRVGEHRLSLQGAVGISVFPHDGHQTPALLRAAEVAWRHACQPGRSGYQFYAQEMEARSLRRLSLEADFRDALLDGAVGLRFQPRIALRSGSLSGAEVQLGWTARDGAVLDTAGVLAFAEDIGQGEVLAHWLVDRACAQLKAWAAAGLGTQRLTLPLLPSALRRSYSVQRLYEILYDHGIGQGQLVLMLSPVQGDLAGDGSGVLMTPRRQDARDWALRLDPLRDAGFGLAIDAGASSACSLAVLRQLPLSEFRLDAQVLDSLDDADGSLAQSSIDLGHRLGLRVVVAGVTTEEQLDRLRRQGADDLQGELLSEPLDAATWADVLQGARPLAPPTAPDGLWSTPPAAATPANTSEPGCDISLHMSTDLAA